MGAVGDPVNDCRISRGGLQVQMLRGHLEKECVLDVDWAYDDQDRTSSFHALFERPRLPYTGS